MGLTQQLPAILQRHYNFVHGCGNGQRADLREEDLCGADLCEAELSYAVLNDADLTNANLRWVQLKGAELNRVHFNNAYMYIAGLFGANLRYSDLSDTCLDRADLRNADLSYAILRNASLIGADLSGANLTGADLTNANLHNAILTNTDFTDAKITAVKGAILKKFDDNGKSESKPPKKQAFSPHTRECSRTDYLTFASAEENKGGEVTISTEVFGELSYIPRLEYSLNCRRWKKFTIGKTQVVLPNIGDTLRLRAVSENTSFSQNYDAYITIKADGYVTADGSIMSLIDRNCKTETIPSNYCFYKLFSLMEYYLLSAPKLPATILKNCCYGYMFYECGGITTAPELPAVDLKESCYEGMFYGCRYLQTPPKLSAAAHNTNDCCFRMLEESCLNTYAVPDGVSKLKYSDLYGMEQIKTVVIPNSVQTIESLAFYDCTELKHIKYIGTKDEWRAIKAVVPKGVAVICSDGEI